MSQTLVITNPTGASVAYMSRDCRLNVPASGESKHPVPEAAVERVRAFFNRYHPLLSVEVAKESEAESETTADETPAKKPAPRKTAASKTKANATDQSQEAASE